MLAVRTSLLSAMLLCCGLANSACEGADVLEQRDFSGASTGDGGTPPDLTPTGDASTAPPPIDPDGWPVPSPDAALPVEDTQDASSPDEEEPDDNAPELPADHCLAGIEGFDKEGPFKFAAKTFGRIKFWVPQVPVGCKVPVVHLANGTTASCGNYQGVLNRLASHGFLTACYEDPNTGAGTQGLEALQTAFKEFPVLADQRIGSTGHSQGGQAAFTVLELAERTFGTSARYAGLAIQPASGFGSQPAGGSWQQIYARIRSPMFMFSGTADTLVSEVWVRSGFNALADDIEAYFWSANGATHIPTPQTATNQVAVAWFRWKLLGDAAACRYFKALPDGRDWDVREEQNSAACL